MSSDQIDPRAPARGSRRRDLMRGALAGVGGLAAPRILPPLADRVAAATPVAPDQIAPPIRKSGLAVRLVDFSTPPRTSATARPYALLNFLYHANDGARRLFAVDSRGRLWALNRTTGKASLSLDMKKTRGSAFIAPSGANSMKAMGFRSFACHPDFGRSGRPGYRKIYTVATETAASRPSSVRVLGGNYNVLFHDTIAEYTAYPTQPWKFDPSTRREVVRIAQYKNGHNTDQLMFDPNATIGTAAYGKMFVTVGDGGNNDNNTDPNNLAQNRAVPIGKILRIDPLRQSNGARYRVPADNPFVGRAGYLPEIYALGLRHPQNMCFDRGATHPFAFIFIDIGQAQAEEVNVGIPGANYGWPEREGTFKTNRLNDRLIEPLPADDSSLGYTYPVAQYGHIEGTASGRAAIVGGFVYRGTAIPYLRGHYLLGDLVTGRIFHVPVADLRLGSLATLQELTLYSNGAEVTLLSLVGGLERADLRFGQDESGELFVMTKQDGIIRKMAAYPG
mgnify:CR=1 FL=1